MTPLTIDTDVELPGHVGPSLLYMVKRVELAVRSHLDQLLKPAGLTALQYTALTVLERHDHQSAAQLARHSFVTARRWPTWCAHWRPADSSDANKTPTTGA